jgi:predicted DNA-binding transcriptional regulator AlpA
MTDDNTAGRNNHARAIIEHTTAHRAAVQDELLTMAEVADILVAPVATLRYRRHRGTGPHSFRIGRTVRYWLHNVTTWLQQQSSASDQPRPKNKKVKPGAGRAGSRDRQRLGTPLPAGLVTRKPSERAWARGCPQLSGERALTSAKTNAPPGGCVPGGTK